MIVYIASYPRSGNFWLQNLFGNQFRRLATNIHEMSNDIDSYRRFANFAKRYYGVEVLSFENSDTTLPKRLSNWIVRYKHPDETVIRKAILPGCLSLLDDLDIRSHLANDKDHYILKTHLPPYSSYLKGEYVLQIVRNPGACLWSYYNFKRDNLNRMDDNLTKIIKGDRDYGSWSAYHSNWMVTAEKIKSNYMLVRYEDIFNRELEFCKRLEAFLGLSIESDALRSFDYYHEIRPSLTREGKADGWEINYSRKQLEILWKTHNKAMGLYGYPEPNYELGAEKDLH